MNCEKSNTLIGFINLFLLNQYFRTKQMQLSFIHLNKCWNESQHDKDEKWRKEVKKKVWEKIIETRKTGSKTKKKKKKQRK